MAPPPAVRRNPNPSVHAYHLCFLLLASTATLSAAVTASSYSSACPSLPPAKDRHTDGDDAVSLISSFQISAGHFSVGSADSSLFSPDDDPYTAHSFYFLPHGASRTDDPALVHLTATFTLTGPAASGPGGRRGNYTQAASVSFVLDGFHSSASLELCMAGTGTERAADGSLKHYPDVVLRLRVPSPPSLADPFVVGTLEGSSGIGTMRLLAYAEGDDYKYGSERAACSPGPPEQPASGSLRALGGVNSAACAHLKAELMTSYRLERGGASLPRMRVDQMHCTADHAGVHVRAYAVLSNDTRPTERRRYRRHRRQRRFLVHEEAVVADGHWDSDRRMLCLTACRVTLPAPPSSPAVRERDCGIGMSFWFPAVWTMRHRSAVAGMLWNYTQPGAGATPGVITASSIDDQTITTNFSDVSYIYNDTMMEEAKKHHHEISKAKKMKITRLFPDFNYSASDFAFFFDGRDIGSGEAYPVTIGSAMIKGDRLAGDEAFFHQHAAAVDDANQGLVNVSYDISHSAPPANMSHSYISNYSTGSDPERMKISAEGVYDPKRGILCMVGCREHNGSTDCRVLVTVQFASVESKAQEQGTGAISSLREKTDSLFFEKIDFTSYGMYSFQRAESISRMDMESILLVASTTLSCVFIVMQILHTKRNSEAAASATSITMLAVLTMGYLAPLVLNSDALFASRRDEYYGFYYPRSRRVELNEVLMRAPILIAFVLQLGLLQLAWSGRRTSTVSERTVLWTCLPLYALGGAAAAIVHAINARAAMSGGGDPSVMIHSIGGGPATMWEDLVSYAGLILDGFLLPQVVLNASLGRSRVPAISPWFYMGGTVVRAAPHVYDVVRAHVYKRSLRSSDLYASPRGDLFGVAWDVVIPCGAALLAVMLFLQQRIGGTTAASLPSSQSQRRRAGGYEMVVSNI